MKKKNLVINTADCDMRNITKELLDSYESITVNAAGIVVTPSVQVLLADYQVTLNCADVLSVDENTELIRYNGVYEIKAGDRIPDHTFSLMVNGRVLIHAGTEELLKKCSKMYVNGQVLCPESMMPHLPPMEVNGATSSYPDGAVVLKNRFKPDKVFVLRAKRQDYFVPGKVLFTDAALNVKKLVEIGVHLIAKKAVVAEGILEDVLLLLDETTEIQLLPEGMNYVEEELTLTRQNVRTYGPRLYVDGDVTLEDAGALKQIQQMIVNGKLILRQELERELEEKGAAIEYRELEIRSGIWISDKISLKLNAAFLEKHDGVIHVADVAKVRIEEDISGEQIEERLRISDCAMVSCSKEQYSAVELIAEDVGKIVDSEEDGGLWDALKGLEDTKMVNTSSYTF